MRRGEQGFVEVIGLSREPLKGRQGIPFEQFRAQRQLAFIAHNRGETPLFAASIERAALST
jgi:hypothetical protein